MQLLLEYSSNPLWIALSLIIISWIWEDGSLISGAIMAADDKISIPLAVTSVFIGISSGDLGMYYLGRLSHSWRRLRGWILTNPKSRELSRRFRKRTFTNILIIRFIPGLRGIGFTLCGLWKISYRRFLLAMLLSGVIWVALIFTIIYQLGSSAIFENSQWKWSLMGAAFLLLIVNNVIVHKKKKGIKSS